MNKPPPTLLASASLGTLLSIAAQTPDGCFVELGVYKGGAAWWLDILAERQGRELHLFDTFTGIPEKAGIDVQHNIGDFGDTDYQAVRYALSRPSQYSRWTNAQIYPGTFPGTMPQGFFPPVAFVHVDMDQYAATLAACEIFWPLLVPGGAMLFDDFNCTDGACQAVHEFFAGVQGLITSEGKVVMIKPGGPQVFQVNNGAATPVAEAQPTPPPLPEMPPM